MVLLKKRSSTISMRFSARLHRKSHVPVQLKALITSAVARLRGRGTLHVVKTPSVVAMCQDNGREFDNAELDSFYAQHGIINKATGPYCRQQNGVAERSNPS